MFGIRFLISSAICLSCLICFGFHFLLLSPDISIFITSFSLPYDISLIFSRDFSKTGLVKFLEFDDEMLNLLISGVFSRNCIGNKICRFIDMYQDLNRPRYNNIYSENWGIWGMEWGKRSVKELLKHKKHAFHNLVIIQRTQNQILHIWINFDYKRAEKYSAR